MKYLMLIVLILGSLNALARQVEDFNKTLIDTVKKDIQKENVDAFKKKAEPSRGPASVDVNEIQEDQKFDKMNNRQTGPSKW